MAQKWPTQKEVLEMMRSGWELGQSTGVRDNRCWLQQGGVGRGGEAKDVHSGTVKALLRRKLIHFTYAFPTGRYELMES